MENVINAKLTYSLQNQNKMNDFLPTDFKIPASPSNYMKLVDGENTFRVLSSAIIGFEYWTNENKPVRSKEVPEETPNIKMRNGQADKVKHFWAFIVWNYATKQIQILELTQKSIMQAIKALVDNKKWGKPSGYDITVTRTGEGLDTEYSVMPNPHSELTKEIAEVYNSKQINLNALYEGKDPFETTKDYGGKDYPKFEEPKF